MEDAGLTRQELNDRWRRFTACRVGRNLLEWQWASSLLRAYSANDDSACVDRTTTRQRWVTPLGRPVVYRRPLSSLANTKLVCTRSHNYGLMIMRICWVCASFWTFLHVISNPGDVVRMGETFTYNEWINENEFRPVSRAQAYVSGNW